MGKPFLQELQAIPETYEWACRQDIGPLKAVLRPLWNHNLVALGSGGSSSAAHFASVLHQQKTGLLACAATPLEFSTAGTQLHDAAVLILSAGGRNPDVLNSLAIATREEMLWTAILCGSKATPLAKLAKSSEFTSLYEYQVPNGKDGFLASNSLVAVYTLLLRAFLPLNEQLPETFREIIGSSDVLSSLEAFISGDLKGLLKRETLIVLYGPATKSAALDLESKLTEAALARVQLADFRNFGHGRHHWLAKRGQESAVVAFSTCEDAELCHRTISLLPSSIPVVTLNMGADTPSRHLKTLASVFSLTARFGFERGIDPGRPSVPEFGRKLYHLRSRKRVAASASILDHAIRRKSRAAGLYAETREREWRDDAQSQLRLLNKRSFEAVVFDYDGTLCSPENRFIGPAPELIRYLIEMLEAQITIGIATGRGRSVRIALQKHLPKHLWGRTFVAYYNGSDIGDLGDDEVPDRSESPAGPLRQAFEILKLHPTLTQQCEITARRNQLTVEPLDGLGGMALWTRVTEALQPLSASGIQVVSSTHSLDVIGPAVSKCNLISFLIDRKYVSNAEVVLAFGDRGKWPGNDHLLLALPSALSTDEVSGNSESGWNFSPPGRRGTKATHYYLQHSDIQYGRLRLRLPEGE